MSPEGRDGETVFTARDGKLWRRGVYLPADLAGRLLPLFRRDREPYAQRLADQLEQAINATTRPSIPSRAVAKKETCHAVSKSPAP